MEDNTRGDCTPTRRLNEKETRRLKFALYAFLFVMIASGLASELDNYTRKLNMGYYKEEPSLPPNNKFADFQILDYHFRIPSSHMYTYYEQRGNRWFENDSVEKVDGGVIFDFFLPEFGPYGETSYQSLDEFYDAHVRVSIADENKSPVGYPPDELIQRLGPGYTEHPSDVAGLRRFDRAHSTDSHYFQQPLNDRYFRMICDGTRCSAWVVFADLSELKVHYNFSQTHIHEWKEIQIGVRRLINQFTTSTSPNRSH